MIKLMCVNEVCKYSYQVSENELKEYGQYHKNCLICGSQLKITQESLDEVVKLDIEQRVKENIDKWLKEIGGDETLSLIQRNKNQACYRLYKEEMIKRGFIVK